MRAFPLHLLLAVLLPQCGGGGSAGPKTPADDSAETTGSEDGAESSAGDTEEASPAEEKSRGPSCDDGTCTLCGSGICPSGWYCDESAPGGAACAWLKECADKPSCSCVGKVLGSACKCREDAGIKVTCN